MSAADNEKPPISDSIDDSSVRKIVSPGAMLRQKRESSNLELSSISRELNLDTWMLMALEEDNFSKFGAQVFAKGHLKHYAQHLGLSTDDVLLAYYQVAERKETTPVINRQLSMTKQSRSYAWFSKIFMYLLALLAISALLYAGYRGWTWYLQDAEEATNSAVTELPLTLDAEVNSAQNISTGLDKITVDSIQSTPAVVPQIEESSIADQNLTSVNTIGGTQDEVSALETERASDEIVASNSRTNPSDGKHSLDFIFGESTWIEVIDENGKKLIFGMANEGTSRQITLTGPTEILLGNALGTSILLNGSAYRIPTDARAGKQHALF